MKTPTCLLGVVLSLTVGACTGTTDQAATSPSMVGGQLAYQSSGGSHRDSASTPVETEVDREPTAVSRQERGVPTPQPARDPAFSPVPQPPIPAPDHHVYGFSY